jgi:hypothetical protein
MVNAIHGAQETQNMTNAEQEKIHELASAAGLRDQPLPIRILRTATFGRRFFRSSAFERRTFSHNWHCCGDGNIQNPSAIYISLTLVTFPRGASGTK